MHQKTFWTISAIATLVGLPILNIAAKASIYQVSTSTALSAGLFHGAVDFKAVKAHGGFGLGSVKDMNGELVALDGRFYRISPTGKTTLIPDEQTTPYAVVTFFHPTNHFPAKHLKDYKRLVDLLNQHITNRNIPYAIKMTGTFSTLYLRAVRGAKPPYPTFAELAKKQAYFTLKKVRGTAVGFFFPPYLSKVNTPGYHIHFINQAKTIGGHILKVSLDNVKVEIMPVYRWTIDFPQTHAYATSKTLLKDYSKGLKASFGAGVQFK